MWHTPWHPHTYILTLLVAVVDCSSGKEAHKHDTTLRQSQKKNAHWGSVRTRLGLLNSTQTFLPTEPLELYWRLHMYLGTVQFSGRIFLRCLCREVSDGLVPSQIPPGWTAYVLWSNMLHHMTSVYTNDLLVTKMMVLAGYIKVSHKVRVKLDNRKTWVIRALDISCMISGSRRSSAFLKETAHSPQ